MTRLERHLRLPLAPRLGRLSSRVSHDAQSGLLSDERSDQRHPPLRIYHRLLVYLPFGQAHLRQQQLANVCVAVTLRDLVLAFA